MIAAEKWHMYQEDYMHYGVDLTPRMPYVEKKVVKKTKIKVSARERSIILMLMAAVGVCAIALIFLQALASDINYSVYSLNQEIREMQGDIDNLNVTLQSQNNLSQIESYASENLHMVYPDKSQRISVDGLVGSAEVNAYIADLSDSQKGIVVSKHVTVADAAKQLLSQA